MEYLISKSFDNKLESLLGSKELYDLFVKFEEYSHFIKDLSEDMSSNFVELFLVKHFSNSFEKSLTIANLKDEDFLVLKDILNKKSKECHKTMVETIKNMRGVVV